MDKDTKYSVLEETVTQDELVPLKCTYGLHAIHIVDVLILVLPTSNESIEVFEEDKELIISNHNKNK